MQFWFLRIISGLGLIGTIMSAISFIYTSSNSNNTLHLTFGKTFNEANCKVNIAWFDTMGLMLMSGLSCIIVCFELFILFNPIKFSFLENAWIRILSYLVLGCSVFGVGADLGIAAGFFNLFVAVAILLIWVFYKMRCVVIVTDQNSLTASTLKQPPL